ncbi:hypothetical protein D3C84_921390 [compost metagenome]
MVRGQVLGKYEKDELFQRWQVLFVAAEEAAASSASPSVMPGVVEAEPAGGGMLRIVTENAELTESALLDAGYRVNTRQSLSLDEILHALMRRGARV